MRVRQIMTQPIITVREDCTLAEVAKTMLDHRIACVPVVNEAGGMVGIITESDFTAKERWLPFSRFSIPQLFGQYLSAEEVDPIYETARTLTAGEVMNPRVIAVTEDDLVRVVLEQMLHNGVNHIPVVRDGLPVGIVARHDLLKMMLEEVDEADPSEGAK